MVIKMSDYLLEQEISTASCDDILLEQYMAEMDVANAIIAAYSKQAMMLEYASEDSVFVEESEEKKPGIFKRIGSAIKQAWIAFLNWCAMLWGKIKGFFQKKKKSDGNVTSIADEIAEKLENLPEEEKKTFKIRSYRILGKIEFLKSASEQLDDLMEVIDEAIRVASDVDASQSQKDAIRHKTQTELNSWHALVKRYEHAPTTSTGRADELDYDEALKEIHELKKVIDDKFNDKIKALEEKTKSLRVKLTQTLDTLNLDGTTTKTTPSDSQYKANANLKDLLGGITDLQTEIMKDVNNAVKTIEAGLEVWKSKLSARTKSKDIQDGLMTRTIRDKTARGDQLDPKEQKYLNDHPEIIR